MKVLLADDSELILERLKEVLYSFEQVEVVASLKNGNEALAALRLLKPDLAIIDIRMPGLSGLEVLNRIRKENKIIKVIIFTLYSSDFYRQLADLLGANYFLSKVDDFDKITLIVSEMILKQDKVKIERSIILRN